MNLPVIAALFAVAAFNAPVESEDAPDIKRMPAGAYQLDRQHSHIGFAVSHVGFSSTRGRFNDYEGRIVLDPGALSKSTGEFVIRTDSIDVNVAELDEELRGEAFFDAARFPEIVYAFRSVELTGQSSGKMTGDLTMKGVTRPLTLDVRLNKILPGPKNPKFTRMGFSAQGVLDRRQWGMDAVDMVGHQVELVIDAEFTLDVGVENQVTQ